MVKKELEDMKRNCLLGLIVLGLISLSVYSTYAMFTSSVETNDFVNMDTIMNYTFEINGSQELTISSKSKLRFNATVKNDMTGKISYGLYYKMINPTTLPSGVTIAEVTDSSSISTFEFCREPILYLSTGNTSFRSVFNGDTYTG